jgi:hypothetical protein
MGTLLGQDIIDGARSILRDATNTATTPFRWDDDHLLRALSRAQREVVRVLPSANPIRSAFKLTRGATLQNVIPTTAFQILEIPRNMGADGKTPGRRITKEVREMIDARVPDWHFGRAGKSIESWTQEKEERRLFYAFPRPDNNVDVWVEILYSDCPTRIEDANLKITVDDVYEYPLSILTAGYALMEDTKGANVAIGEKLESRGYAMLGGSFAVQKAAGG